jgi:hypothetical protein
VAADQFRPLGIAGKSSKFKGKALLRASKTHTEAHCFEVNQALSIISIGFSRAKPGLNTAWQPLNPKESFGVRLIV